MRGGNGFWGVNLWGVIHGVRTFVPLMLAQDEPCHIVNTASVAGLLSNHISAPYQVTKHAVVALTESLYFSLAATSEKVKTSVLCPGWVPTHGFWNQGAIGRTRWHHPVPEQPLTPEQEELVGWFVEQVEGGMSPAEVAVIVFQAIRAEQLYILTDPTFNGHVLQRIDNIVHQRNPVLNA